MLNFKKQLLIISREIEREANRMKNGYPLPVLGLWIFNHTDSVKFVFYLYQNLEPFINILIFKDLMH